MKKRSVAQKKPVSKLELSRFTNPLPEDQVGERLLVNLQAEKVIKKRKLPGLEEGAFGYSFAEVRALVAHALGEAFMAEGEAVEVARLTTIHPPKELAKIAAKASPPLVSEAGGYLSVLPEAFEGLLILGLGTPTIPLPPRGNLGERAWLAEELAKLIGVDSEKVDVRGFERARKKVLDRFLEHQANQRRRGLESGGQEIEAPVKTQPSLELLQSYFAMVSAKIGQSSPKGGPTPVERAMLMERGIKVPKGTPSAD